MTFLPALAATLLQMRDQDWTAVTAVASIALVGLLCIALAMSVERDEPRRR